MAIILAGAIYLRLLHGPIHVAFVGDILTSMFNAESTRVEAELGDVVLTLGDPGEPAGLQFIDVRVRNAEGALLFAVPKLAAKFDLSDLSAGRPWPTGIAVIGPEARILRTADGRFRFGLGGLSGSGQSANGAATADSLDEAMQFAAVQRLIDGFVGDIEPAPEVSRLARIEILGAELTYEDEVSGRQWHTRRADLRLFRIDGGARAQLDIGLADAGEAGAVLSVSAERRQGTKATRLAGRFARLRPEHLAEQLAQMDWLRLFDAPLAGRMAGVVHSDGRIEGLSGTLRIGAGRVLALGEEGQPIDGAELGFEYEPGLARMRVTGFELRSRALQARLSGFIDMAQSASGSAAGLDGQLEIERIRLELPSAFPEPLEFDGGQIAARLRFSPMRIEVAQAYLRSGDLVLDVQGRAAVADGIWHTDLRASGRNLTVGDLLHHWPLAASQGARWWIDHNIRQASIDGAVAHMRFDGSAPTLALDFTFSQLESTYLEDMSAIRNARGRGALTLDAFNLFVDAAEVEPVAGAPVQISGSEVRFPALRARPSPGEVTIRGTGPTASILTLINEDPLNLISRLGLDPATIAGHSEVAAELRLPLIEALTLNDVRVEAVSVLYDLQMPFGLPNGQVVDVAGQQISLEANTASMHFAGDASVDGRPMFIDWNEYYGRGSNQREMVFRGAATPALLARFGIGDRNFKSGEAPMLLELAQSGTPVYAFKVSADVGPAELVVPELGWTKPPGPRGKLDARGSYGETALVDGFTLDTDELWATGQAELGDEGYVRSARIDRAQYLGLADIAAEVRRGEDDAFLIRLGGNRVDLAVLDTMPEDEGDGAGGGAVPIEMQFRLDELVVTPRLTALPASGTYRRDRGSNRTARLEGMAAGLVPFVADLSRLRDEPGKLTLTSDQAGELLAAARLFSTARGGEMVLTATLAPDDLTNMDGEIKIKDVTVRGTGTFTSILDQGGVKDAATAAKQGGGLFFDKVDLPFTYRDGILSLDDSTAKGKLVAVKMEGTVDENADQVDIVGVISPIYALTGLLDSIPLIGDILSGGKGEGVLAMTFSVSGSIEEPQFNVNPLALLAPGFLRKIFTGRNRRPDDRFIEQLQRETD